MSNKPLLSIGMIVKNEIRCLEKCLKALQPLRDAIHCELVIADTGSTDGTREVAQRYADICFDFEWNNDFAAARNAVMDRCGGMWYLTVDADECLDENIDELVRFLTADVAEDVIVGAITQRNYESDDPALADHYADLTALRVLRMSTGIRYEGAIHETWYVHNRGRICMLNKVVLHHSGYVVLQDQRGDAKRERNLAILHKELERNPNDLRTLSQCIESAKQDDKMKYILQAVKALKAKSFGWKEFGASVLRYAAICAFNRRMPELQEWSAMAMEWFPDSAYTRIDVNYVLFRHAMSAEKYADAVSYGEAYLNAVKDDRAGKFAEDYIWGTVMYGSPHIERELRIRLAHVCYMDKRPERMVELLDGLDGASLNAKEARNYLALAINLHTDGYPGLAPMVRKFWGQINQSRPNETVMKERRETVLAQARLAFEIEWVEQMEKLRHLQPAWTIFRGISDLGGLENAVKILDFNDINEIEGVLQQADVNSLPAATLRHALRCGAAVSTVSLSGEEIQALADRVVLAGEAADSVALLPAAETTQAMLWERALLVAALGRCDLKRGGVRLMERFAQVEERYLSLYYTEAALQDEGFCGFSHADRFAMYFLRARAAKENGDEQGYLAMIREGLRRAPAMKPAAEALLQDFRRTRAAEASPELVTLAEQVKTILAQYPADDPAVVALKATPAYQQVAFLIEE